jgi:hypothetical protein
MVIKPVIDIGEFVKVALKVGEQEKGGLID